MVDATNMLRSTGSAHQKSLYSGFSLIPIAMLMAKNARISSTLVTCQFRLEVAYRSSATIAAGGLLATAFRFVAITMSGNKDAPKSSLKKSSGVLVEGNISVGPEMTVNWVTVGGTASVVFS